MLTLCWIYVDLYGLQTQAKPLVRSVGYSPRLTNPPGNQRLSSKLRCWGRYSWKHALPLLRVGWDECEKEGCHKPPPAHLRLTRSCRYCCCCSSDASFCSYSCSVSCCFLPWCGIVWNWWGSDIMVFWFCRLINLGKRRKCWRGWWEVFWWQRRNARFCENVHVVKKFEPNYISRFLAQS